MADPENPDNAGKSDPAPAEKSGGGAAAGGAIGLTMSYIKSIPGILKIVEFVSTLSRHVMSFRTQGFIYSHFGRLVVILVWSKESGLTKRLEIEPSTVQTRQ